MLRLSELPRWLRKVVGWAYLVWALIVTAFTGYVLVRSLGFDGEAVPTIETVVLLAGLLVAPLFPFARRLFFPGGGGVDFDAARTREEGRAAEAGIERAALASALPPLDFESEGERE